MRKDRHSDTADSAMNGSAMNGPVMDGSAAGQTKDEKGKRGRRALMTVGALLVILAVFAAGWLGSYFSVSKRDRSLLWMLHTVEENYREDVDPDKLYDRLYDAMELDRFCAHYTPEEYAEKVMESQGTNVGYGISFITEGDSVRIFRVVGNSPAELAGLRQGMYVFSCGGKVAVDSASVAAFMREAEEDVTLECGMEKGGADKAAYTLGRARYSATYCIYRDSEGEFSFRGEVPVLTRTGEGVVALGDAAYIKLDAFDGNAAREFGLCMEKMRERGRRNLVLDLRSNGGGYLSTLCGISSYLLRDAGRFPVVATARYRDGSVSTYRAAGNVFSDYFGADSQIYVLADENTASASEALIGALIDYGSCGFDHIYLRKEGDDEARTYGKGVMQSHFTAPDGNVMQLTVANIVWPSGRSIHEVGITESDGAIGISAPLVWGTDDPMLAALCLAMN